MTLFLGLAINYGKNVWGAKFFCIGIDVLPITGLSNKVTLVILSVAKNPVILARLQWILRYAQNDKVNCHFVTREGALGYGF